MPVPAVGTVAPDFTLNSTSGQPVSLSQYKGKERVLLAFFPLAFTGVCTAEMCAFTEEYDQFAAAGVAVLPISVDSVPTLKEFKAKHNLSVELLSDFKREAESRLRHVAGGTVLLESCVLPDRCRRHRAVVARRGKPGQEPDERGRSWPRSPHTEPDADQRSASAALIGFWLRWIAARRRWSGCMLRACNKDRP